MVYRHDEFKKQVGLFTVLHAPSFNMYFGNERDLPKDMLGILREFESRIYRVRKKDASKAWFNKFNTKYSNKNKMYIFLNSDLVENYANNEEV